MIIDELTLVGYKRFALSGMKGITIKPTKQMQILIGTNGCGKSSFLSELSPLPADKDDFPAGGSKTIVIRHQGSHYILVSTFGDGHKHTFEKDGEPLNDGRTVTVQKELVKRFFGMTPELHKILLGKITFSEMGPQDRRKLITQLAPTDYTFALNLFNHYRTKARDEQGVVKHLAARITHETQKLHNLGNLEGLEDRVKLLNDELRVLLSHRREGIEAEPFDPLPILSSLESDIAFCQEQLTYVPKGKAYKSMDDVLVDIETLERECVRHRDFKDRYATEFMEVEDTIHKLMRLQGEDGTTTTLEDALRSLDHRILENHHQIQCFSDLTNPTQLLGDIQSALPSLVELFQLLPDNTDDKYSKSNMEGLKSRIHSITASHDDVRNSVDRLEFRIESFQSMQEMACPSCQFVWRPGFSEHEHQRLLDMAVAHRQVMREQEEVIEQLTTEFGEIDEVSNHYRQFRLIVNAYPRLTPLWDAILKDRLHMNNPRGNIGIFYQFENDVAVQIRLDELIREKTDLEALKLNPQANSEVGYLHTRLNELTAKVHDHTQAYITVQAELDVIKGYYQRLIRLSTCLTGIEEKVTIIQGRSVQEIERLRNQHIDRAMGHRHGELASMQSSLSDKNMMSTIIEDLEQSYRTSEIKAQVYKVLAKAMSPTEGVTADQLMAPLRSIVGRVNAIIGKVWTYDMTVLPCNVDDGELDYKFPIQNMAPDIAMGSKSMVHMINFAFRLVVMYYLKLHEYPYYLDELEEGFDERHRPALVGLIQNIMELHPTSQIFMVSHYFSMYGSMSSSQICVLDDANVSVPEIANEHVTFL
jgi:hypothetical protein